MSVQKIIGCAASAAIIAAFASAGPTQAGLYPAAHFGTQNIHHVDCAVGFHLGPVGACVIGAESPPPRAVVVDPGPTVVEHRDDPGCETKSVKRQDSDGNSETHTKTNCN